MSWSAFAKEWVLPPGLTAALQRARLQGSLTGAGRAQLDRNRQLRDRHAGGRIFILCSGPSIKTQDLTVLRGEICLGVSNFFVHPDYATINPRYHCIAPLHPPFTDTDGLRWFREMAAPLAKKEIFLSVTDRRLAEAAGLAQSARIHNLALGRAWRDSGREQVALDQILPGAQSVSIIALMIALYLGCKEIYLVGVDHTSVNFQTGQYTHTHFYTGTRTNALGEMPKPVDLESEFAAFATLWHQYKIVRALAARQGAQILNATRGGILDLFPRVELEAVAAGRRP